MAIKQYSPRNIQCLDPIDGAPPPSKCDEVVELIPRTNPLVLFGPPSYGPREVQIPTGFDDGLGFSASYCFDGTDLRLAATHRCAVVIDNPQGQSDMESWVHFWEEAVAINAMCVRRGMSGWSIGLGTFIDGHS